MARLKHLEVLVEEPSAEAALRVLLPKILGREISWNLLAHQGKSDLIGKLVGRLRGYRRWIPEDWGVVVLLDADRGDCHLQKAQLETLAREAGFSTPSAAGPGAHVQLLNRLAVEELEAWFLGDVPALRAAYPKLSTAISSRFSDPDRLRGTWEALERLLQRAGYHRGGLEKIRAAREIAAEMDPERNRSRSFQAFRRGLLDLAKPDLTSPA